MGNTSSLMTPDQQEIKELGFNDFFFKPIREYDLLNLIKIY